MPFGGEWLVTRSLPVEAMARATPVPAVHGPEINTRVVEIPAGETATGRSAPTARRTARSPSEGSGGGFLSNEVAYRNALRRYTLAPGMPAGHLHVPVLQFGSGNPDEITDPTYEANREAIVDGAHPHPARGAQLVLRQARWGRHRCRRIESPLTRCRVDRPMASAWAPPRCAPFDALVCSRCWAAHVALGRTPVLPAWLHPKSMTGRAGPDRRVVDSGEGCSGIAALGIHERGAAGCGAPADGAERESGEDPAGGGSATERLGAGGELGGAEVSREVVPACPGGRCGWASGGVGGRTWG